MKYFFFNFRVTCGPTCGPATTIEMLSMLIGVVAGPSVQDPLSFASKYVNMEIFIYDIFIVSIVVVVLINC